MKRALLMERRRFVEEPEEKLTLREALLLAVEALRGDPDERMEKAAALLDRKAMKLRAREEATITVGPRCLCGRTRREKDEFCAGCHAAIPLQIWLDFHGARSPREMGEAWRKIVDGVEDRRR